ncbi:MAG: polysaccharide deacetylase family protein [Bacillota bacterium]|jgi:peptidoglycan/xylan/chitin deacetylase (PgdA/CDA1 family)|nr:polysaccharide deacetylase [Clostridia bacterium]
MENNAYFGSVRFFKHLIYITMFSILLSILLGLLFYGNNRLLALNTYAATDATKNKEAPLNETNISNEREAKNSASDTEDIKDKSEPENPSSFAYPKSQNYNSFIDYQLKYPELYVEHAVNLPKENKENEKIAYLTFDDGPSTRTLEILDILKKEDIKATFFVVTQNMDSDILKRTAEEGHAIGVHSHTHKYKEIYNSVEDYLDDFNTAFEKIYEETSIKPQVFRFPGGSINIYNRGIYQEIISEMLRRGFLFYDWNISVGDTQPNTSADKMIKNVKSGLKGQNKLIILFHDSKYKEQTVKALPEIIKVLKQEGYSFDKLDNGVEPIAFSYPIN